MIIMNYFKETGFTVLPRFPNIVLAMLLLVASAPSVKVYTQQKNAKDLTAEQIAELAIFVFGQTRERIAQIQRNGVERGRVTRTTEEGSPEESTYERRFVRGETSDKDKIRVDQKKPTMEYSLVYSGGRTWGIINGTSFTPRQEVITEFLAPIHRGISTLLRYKENGATLALVGKEKQKGIEMWVLDLVDQEKRRTRYFISSQKWRVLWLEYEETPSGESKPIKYKRTFHEYRYAQGQLIPYRSVLYSDGKQLEEYNVLTVSFGIKMDDSYFQETPPTENAGGER